MGLVFCLFVAACAVPAPPPSHDRIVSTNPCLDAILVELVPPERIAAISRYSHDPRSSSMAVSRARRLRATGGTAEEVIALKPGLVLASSFTAPATLAAYQRLGLKVATFGTAATIEENRTQIREIARAVGEPQRGEALIARIDRAVAEAAPPDAARPSALLWLGGSNLVNGHGTLIDDMLGRAGFRNASADYGVTQTGVLPLEYVVSHPPRVVLTPERRAGADEESRRIALRTEALSASHARVTIGHFPEQLFYCGGPTIVPAMQRLAAIRRQVTP
ncbi:putative ABC transporter substrate-binding protein [Sphingomonas changbaiensis NBRC 104936]|uniref:Putative ABC transporter substrate-binding protein n=1 Tax=Sphingomonas changbaiensis NBRC 104936 TaxID=1219043 RepID=A0A0E9MKK8_9SPHN|nr:ABC transporter substrate-binding protein [Sphingomonas changbaiensis]GAO38342.1 putative ABC transporter substrate-binding protein [Sphingomonas changbaiensis NBRC 104936]